MNVRMRLQVQIIDGHSSLDQRLPIGWVGWGRLESIFFNFLWLGWVQFCAENETRNEGSAIVVS